MNNQPTTRIGDSDFEVQYWELNGKKHREDGPAVKYSDGSEYWFLNDFLHRDDGPAVIDGGYGAWYQHGKLHRVDGPACIDTDGTKRWYLNGIPYLYENWFKQLTPEQQYNYLWNIDE
jgi:hypothetical protein